MRSATLHSLPGMALPGMALPCMAPPGLALSGLALLGLALLAGGCSNTLYAQTDFRSGQTLAPAQQTSGMLRDKADVLARLGSPGEVIPLARGDIFIYRLRDVDVSVLNVHTGLVGLQSVSLFADIDGRVVDAVVFVSFDEAGRVLDVGRSPGR